jgi:hypothetical protein
MWDQKRLLSEPSGEFQPFPHICPTDQRTPKGLQTGAHGSAAGSGASRTKARTGEANQLGKEEKQAQSEQSIAISITHVLEEK